MNGSGTPPRFTVESTLGKLAKWLRLLGFDTRFEQSPPKFAAADEERIVLTRTRSRFEQLPEDRRIFIHCDLPEDQLKEVIERVPLTSTMLTPFTRCLRCNEPIQSAPRSQVRDRVPDYVWETQAAFRKCPRCDRIYWPGTHTAQSLKRIRRLFANG